MNAGPIAMKNIIVGFLIFAALSLGAAYFLPDGIDWHLTFRPAILAMMGGRSPYNDPAVLAPFAGAPWVLIPFIPLAYLPENLGRGVLFSIGVFSFAFAAIRMGARPAALVAFLLSPVVFHCLLNSNLDFLPIVGFILPPQVGLFFMAAKPQMGMVVGAFWFVQSWRSGGWREALRVFGPATGALIISFFVYGIWPENAAKILDWSRHINASLWPQSIPVGLALAVTAFRLKDMRYAIAASPLLSPYLLFHSWSGALFAVLASPAESIAAVVGLWVLVLLRGLGWA